MARAGLRPFERATHTAATRADPIYIYTLPFAQSTLYRNRASVHRREEQSLEHGSDKEWVEVPTSGVITEGINDREIGSNVFSGEACLDRRRRSLQVSEERVEAAEAGGEHLRIRGRSRDVGDAAEE